MAAVITREDGQVLIARRAPHKSLPGRWEFPGGKVEPGEDPRAALERELLEEFGVPVKAGASIGSRQHQYPGLTVELDAYRATCAATDFTLDSHDAIAWVKPAECRQYDMAEADWFIVDALEEENR